MEFIMSEVVPGTPWVATAKEFVQEVFAEGAVRGDGGWPRGLQLRIEKIVRPGERSYRLAWAGRGQMCLADEDTTAYPTRTPALAAGTELAASMQVRFGS